MRWKFETAIKILEKIEPDPKIDRTWENRSHIYGILKRKGYHYRNWKGEPSRWIEPLDKSL